ncbi:MAG: hypothetical protein ACR2F9_04830 [Longimicrobiaceae bacterium]
MPSFDRRSSKRLLVSFFFAAALLSASGSTSLAAQTDYYNLDAGRPVLIEDAYPTERYAFELQLAPLRLERESGGVYHWGVEPEIAYGILPRTQVEVGVPVVFRDVGGDGELGVAGIDLAVLHNLNVETSGLPAFGIAADVLLPVGEFAPARVYPSLKGIVTRTFGFARFHVNGQVTFGPDADPLRDVQPLPAADDIAVAAPEDPHLEEVSRWLAGVAVDRTLPLKSMLLIADVYARQPLVEDDDVEWNVGAGVRYQLSPRLAIDGGVGRRLTGDPGWFVTFGTAYAFAIRSLMPGG